MQLMPHVNFCGLDVTRLIIGGNPFSGFSHQSRERDEEMMDYYTVARIKETLARAEQAGYNTTIMRSDYHIHRLLREYYNEGGQIEWIAQVCGNRTLEGFAGEVSRTARAGAVAGYLHGGLLDACYADRDEEGFARLVEALRKGGFPVGTAGHSPEAHLWAYELDVELDFHVVCFYNCGSLHDGKGEKFRESDPPRAIEAIQQIDRPVIAYKIMAAGRVEPRAAFERAFDGIKPNDVVNVGMYRGDNDDMVEENARMVSEIAGG